MKRIAFLFAVISVFLGLISCIDDVSDLQQTKVEVETNSNYVPISEALENLEPFFNGGTKSQQPEISSVELLPVSRSTRGEESNFVTPFYIVNFANNQGFAILSSDRRLESVYAFSDEGSLELKDTINNPSLSFYLNEIVLNEARESSADPTINPQQGSSINPVTPPFTYVEIPVEPLISKDARRLGQKAPYNQYCLTPSGKQAVAGCTAVATTQVLSYYNYPRYINGYPVEWANVVYCSYSDDAKKGVALIYRLLGEKNLLNMKYGELASSAQTDSVVSTFKKLGYPDTTFKQNFSLSSAITSLNNLEPILLIGNKPIPSGEFSDPHIWSVDGYLVKHEGSYKEYYLHCNWGYEGSNNGYFLYRNYTNTLSYNREYYAEDDIPTLGGGNIITHNLQLIHNFGKKRQ